MATRTPVEYIQLMNSTLYNDSSLRELYIELATLQTNNSYFGDLANYAIALRAMHNYIIDSQRVQGEAGLVTSKSEGSASIRYWNKVVEGRYSDLQMTHYGQRLLAIIKSRGPGISISGDDNELLTGGSVSTD